MPDIKSVIDMMVRDGKSPEDIKAVITRYNQNNAEMPTITSETPMGWNLQREFGPLSPSIPT